jgi:hypothetical protein
MSKVILSEITTLGEQGTLKISSGSKIDLTKNNSYLQLPKGSTEERPNNSTSGEIRYNTDTKLVEYYDGTQWQEIEYLEDYNSITKAGLVLHLDASSEESYPGSGDNWYDLSSYGSDFILYGNTVITNDNTFLFDGNGDYAENSTQNFNLVGNIETTLEGWFYFTGSNGTGQYTSFFTYGNGPSARDTISIGLFDNFRISASFNGGLNAQTAQNLLSPNTWNHIVVTKTPGPINTTTKIYLNGVQQTIVSAPADTPNVVARVVRVGRWTNEGAPYYYQGEIAACSIYSRALTSGEIWKNYVALAPRFGIDPIPSIVTNGLVAHFDAANYQSYPRSGNTWIDLSGNGNNATISGATYSSFGGGSFDFDGTNDFAEAPDSPTLDMETAWSIESWCRREGGAPAGEALAKIISKWENYFLAVDFNNGADIYACVGTGSGHTCLAGGADRDNELPLNTWTHLMVTYSESSGTARIYYNGTQIESWTAPATASTNNPLCIGSAGTGTIAQNQYFNGKISVAKVYNRELSAVEVQQNFNALRTRYGI